MQSLVTLTVLAALIIPAIEADLATARASLFFVSLLLLVESGSSVWHGSFKAQWVECVAPLRTGDVTRRGVPTDAVRGVLG